MVVVVVVSTPIWRLSGAARAEPMESAELSSTSTSVVNSPLVANVLINL